MVLSTKLIGNEATKLARQQPAAQRATHREPTLGRIGAPFQPPLPIEDLAQAA